MRLFAPAAVAIAIVALGAVAAFAAGHPERLASARQLAQAAETPPPPTGNPAPEPPSRPAPEQTGTPSAPEAAATVLDDQDVMAVLGVRVRSNAGEDMGRVINVIVDRTGQVRAAVIDFGGFLGVGNRKVVVDWNALHFSTAANKDDRITLDLTRDQVKAAPEYKEGRPLVVLGTAEGAQPSAPAD
jgi:PRC-barrel domain